MFEQWIEQFLQIAGPYIVELSVVILLVIALFNFIKYNIIKLRPLLEIIRKFNQFLEQLDNDGKDNISIINDYFVNTSPKSHLYRAWNNYYNNRTTSAEIALYFNPNNLIDIPTDRDKAAIMPAFLTTLGLILAFIDLFVGLYISKSSLVDLTVIFSILGGVLFLAIFTVIVSSIYHSVDNFRYKKALDTVYDLQQYLKFKLNNVTDKKHIDEIIVSIDNMTSSLASYAQYTVDMQKSGINQMVDSFLNSLNNEMNGQFTTLGESLEKSTISQLKANNQMELLIEELAKGASNQYNINKNTEEIISAITEYHDLIMQSNRSLSTSLFGLQELSNALSGIVNFNSEALETVKFEREILKNEYGKYIDGIKDQIQIYQTGSANELDHVMTRFSDLSGKTFGSLESSIIKSMDEWTNSNKSMLLNLDEQSKSLVSVSKDIAIRLSELNTGLVKTVKEFTEALQGGTVNTLTEFDDGLGEITLRLSQTITEIRDSIDELPAVIESLKQIS